MISSGVISLREWSHFSYSVSLKTTLDFIASRNGAKCGGSSSSSGSRGESHIFKVTLQEVSKSTEHPQKGLKKQKNTHTSPEPRISCARCRAFRNHSLRRRFGRRGLPNSGLLKSNEGRSLEKASSHQSLFTQTPSK